MTASLLLLCIFCVVSILALLPASVITLNTQYGLLAMMVIVLAIMGAMQLKAISLIALLAVLMFISTHYLYSRKIRFFSAVLATIGIFGFSLSLFPGFITTILVDPVFLGAATLPFTLKITYAKGIIGLLILVFWVPAEATLSSMTSKLRASAVPAVALVMLLLFFSTFFGYRFDPKWYWFTPVFLMSNLCLSVMAEEVFFRGVIQRNLRRVLLPYTSFAGWIALMTVAIFFGVLHSKGGITYALLTTLAGLIYGGIYWRYNSIHAAILCHFLVNMLHFTLLTYPG